MSDSRHTLPDGNTPEVLLPGADAGRVWVDVRSLPPRPQPRRWLHLVLLLATLGTTTLIGGFHWLSFEANFQPAEPAIQWISFVFNGLWYAGTIMLILGAHEAGHYLACRAYGIDASLPYFIPAPPPLLTGTLGAFIRIRSPITSKRELFDVGVAGPIAGFVVVLPALLAGLWMSRLVPIPPDFSGLELGEPPLFKALAWLVWGDVAEGLSINLHPMAFAAWFGMLATALNLIPIGQFDGGHIAYAVLGRRASWITLASVGAAVALSLYSSSWIVWTLLAVFLLYKFGWRHPAVWDEDVPLDASRRWLALVALIILVLCFTPVPISPLDLVGTP